MKKCWFLVALVLLAGCSEVEKAHRPVVYPTSFAMETDDFLYEIEVNDERFSGEVPVITAALTYIGDEEEIVISHAASPFYFDVTETTTGYTAYYFMEMPQLYTTLKKGEPLTERYMTSGGYSETEDEAYRQFMQAFLKDDYPAGNYAVHGYARFHVDGEPAQHELGGHIGFRME